MCTMEALSMDLIRVGDKLISMPKIANSIEEMLNLRRQGHSQAEVAKKFGIDRTFVSRLENLGEIRKDGILYIRKPESNS